MKLLAISLMTLFIAGAVYLLVSPIMRIQVSGKLPNDPMKKNQEVRAISDEQLKQNFQIGRAIDIKLLERIETIEKKLKIVPPKDSIALKKAEKK